MLPSIPQTAARIRPIREVARALVLGVFAVAAGPSIAAWVNLAPLGTATQTTEWNGGQFPAALAIDGAEDTFSHTDVDTRDNAWQLTFDREQPASRVEIVTRTDCCGGRLTNAVVRVFDGEGDSVFDSRIADPGPGSTLAFDLPPGTRVRRLRVGFEDGATGPAGMRIVHLGEVRVLADIDLRPVIERFEVVPASINPGDPARLAWRVASADRVEISGLGEVDAEGVIDLEPEASREFLLVASSPSGARGASTAVIVGGTLLPPRITEFLAANDGSLVRGDGSTPDWIEVANPNPLPLDVSGFHLTDDPNRPARWAFPDGLVVPAGGRLVVHADERALDGVPATGFALAREEGSFLALTDPEGGVVQAMRYPGQRPDIAYGFDHEGRERFLVTPTPGEVNAGEAFDGFVADTRFSVDRGFFDAPITVSVESATEGAVIWVTTDGTIPAPDNPAASPYTGPIAVDRTTVLRAAAFREGFRPSNVDTQSYLFPADIVAQPAQPAGFPERWVPAGTAGVNATIAAPSDYAMDPRVVGAAPFVDGSGEAFDVPGALEAIPTFSLVLPIGDLLDPVTGLHVNARSRGRAWERPASLEFIDPATGGAFQVECGIRMHGGWNRFPEMLKKSLRLYFRSEYGDAKFRHALFPDLPVDEFDRLILRSGNGKVWCSPWRALGGGGNSLPRTLYLRDQFVRDSQRDMGHPHVSGRFAHLYVNGLYWGLYNPVVRPDEHFASTILGGNDDDYDVIKWVRGTGHQVAAGSDDAWNALIARVRRGVADLDGFRDVGALLDLENFADYLLVNFWAGNGDWIDNNLYAMRNRAADGPFRFFCWDSEETFISTGADATDRVVADTCTEIHQALRANPEYRLLFADRVQRHLFHDGALTPGAAGERFAARVAEIDRAIVAESARWGDLMRPTAPYTREDDWLREVANIRTNYLPRRGDTVFAQLRADGLVAPVAAPAFMPSRGGAVPAGTRVTLSSPDGAGTIWFTLDGSDPRLPGGAVSPVAQAFDGATRPESLVEPAVSWRFLESADAAGFSTSDVVAGHPAFDASDWKHPEFDDAAWASGHAPLGYGGITGVDLATTLPLGAAGGFRPITTWFRHAFGVPDAARFTSLNLRLLRDDGAIVYLNGREIARSNLPDGATITPATTASPVGGFDEGEFVEFPVPPGLLVDGRNVLAVEVHQESDTSSDLGFALTLGGDATLGGATAITIDGDTLLRARVQHGDAWSAIDEARFLVGDRARDLVVSEILFHPGAGIPEAAEFVEFENRGEVPHRLDDLEITGGIRFGFDAAGIAILDPGARLLVVRDPAAFAAAWPGVDPALVAGRFDGALDNDGDAFSLVDDGGQVLWTLEYGDDPPWPDGADGGGRSLVWTSRAGEVPSDPAAWRPSTRAGGSPGGSDSLPFGGGDLRVHAMGSNVLPAPQPDGAGGWILGIPMRLGADDASITPEWSSDAATWHAEGWRFEGVWLVAPPGGDQGGDRAVARWRLPAGVGDPGVAGRLFFRARVALEP